jgi:hypothetical protein
MTNDDVNDGSVRIGMKYMTGAAFVFGLLFFVLNTVELTGEREREKLHNNTASFHIQHHLREAF